MRSGTTYLATVLDEHPEISMAKPLIPEPKFFLKEEEYKRGLEFYQEKYFDKNKKARVFGEKTVHYSEREDALIKIREDIPDAKIIMILRNPVYRAISNYFFSFANGIEKRTAKEVFVDNTPEPEWGKSIHISPFKYLQRSIYINSIRLLEKYFDNIKIIISEEFFGNIKEIRKLYEYLNVDTSFIPGSLNKRIYGNEYCSFDKVDNAVIKKLELYFKEYNTQLEKCLGRKIEVWG